MPSPTARALCSVALLSAWMILLFSGWVLGGAIHLLLLAALAIFPWRAVQRS